MKAIKYIPSAVMRKLTKKQLKIVSTQRNTKGKYSINALKAQTILWYASNRTNMMTGTVTPLTASDRGWQIPQTETVDLTPYLNGSEVAE